MSIKRFKPLLLQLLDNAHGLVTGPNTRRSQFAEVLEGTFRRDYVAALAILELSQEKNGNESVFGKACMVLARRMIEDMVSIDYMLFEGKEEMTEKFKAFRCVESKQTLEFLRDVEMLPSEEAQKIIEENYVKAKDEHFKSEKNLLKCGSWLGSGKGIRWMIGKLTGKVGVFSDLEKLSVIHMYTTASGCTHFSPSGVLDYIWEGLFNNSNQHNLNSSMFIATFALSRLAMRFINEIEVDEKTRKAVNDIWREAARLKPS